MSCGFLLLTYTDTMRFWASTYYALHSVLALVIPLLLVVNRCEGKTETAMERETKKEM